MLLLEDSRRERVARVVVSDPDRRLPKDRSRVRPAVDEVDGASRDADAIGERLGLRVDARESR
jgi:hypothetical protein